MKQHRSTSHRSGGYSAFIALLLWLCAGASGQKAETSRELVRYFRASQYFWQQLEVAKKIGALYDAGVLKDIEANLNADDRHLRGNAAFVFAGLGDDRGLTVIYAILRDRSSLRPESDGVPVAPWSVTAQNKADRYYAVHDCRRRRLYLQQNYSASRQRSIRSS